MRWKDTLGREAYRDLLAAGAYSTIAAQRPRDMIDVQSFLWVQGSDEYPD